MCLKLGHYLNYYIHKLGTRVDLRMPYMLMLVLMTLTLMQGHSTSAKATNQLCMLSSTKQAISIKLATEVGGVFLCDLDLDFANICMVDPLVFFLEVVCAYKLYTIRKLD